VDKLHLEAELQFHDKDIIQTKLISLLMFVEVRSVTPAAKLLMCICAGSTGAVMVPATHKVRAAIRPRPAIHSAPAHSPAIAAVPCAAVPQIALGDGLPEMGPSGFAALDSNVATSPIGFSGGSGGGQGGVLGGGAGASPPPALLKPEIVLPSPPITSPTPEVTTWSMMVVGAGAVGGAIRWRRREQTA
jgi:hypothetical protein